MHTCHNAATWGVYFAAREEVIRLYYSAGGGGAGTKVVMRRQGDKERRFADFWLDLSSEPVSRGDIFSIFSRFCTAEG